MTHIQRLFKDFNRDYFGWKVPSVDVEYADKHIPEWGHCYRDSILLSPVLKRYQLAMEGVLLHEMIHAYLEEDEHTPQFLALQRKLNKRHFGSRGNHKVHFDHMIKDLNK